MSGGPVPDGVVILMDVEPEFSGTFVALLERINRSARPVTATMVQSVAVIGDGVSKPVTISNIAPIQRKLLNRPTILG